MPDTSSEGPNGVELFGQSLQALLQGSVAGERLAADMGIGHSCKNHEPSHGQRLGAR